jgi:hypothetical protein
MFSEAARRSTVAGMRLGLRHWCGDPQWVSETPVIDVVRTGIGVASVLIGCYAALFVILALQAATEGQPPRNALFFAAIALANGRRDAVRHWRRHQGGPATARAEVEPAQAAVCGQIERPSELRALETTDDLPELAWG